MTGPAALVEFKRDLRVRDHAPLAAAMHFEYALGLVVVEPQWLQSRDCNPRCRRPARNRRRAGRPGPIVPVELTIPNPGKDVMNLFNKLPGFVRSPPGWEHLIWQRLPAILLWGTLLPLVLAGLNHALAPAAPESGASNGALLLWDYQMFGVVVLHWTLTLTVALGCFIVRVMKGPAYVADPYPFPDDDSTSMRRP